MSTTPKLEEMDVGTFMEMSDGDKETWCRDRLTPVEQDVRRAAEINKIPPQLIATVVLNELADIDWRDVWQQRWWKVAPGSLGIAQIQVSTARSYRLLDFPGDKELIQTRARKVYRERQQNSRQGIVSQPFSSFVASERDMLIRQRLTIPELAIAAAAKEIRRLIELMTQNLTNPWQQRFSFSLTSVSQLAQPNDIYRYIAGAVQVFRELKLTEMVVAAYNSPDIIIAKNPNSITRGHKDFRYPNAMNHGSNATVIAYTLFNNNLFH